jgi:prefoldin subunit 5
MIDVRLFQHPKGDLLRIEIGTNWIVLDSEEALELLEKMKEELPKMSVNLTAPKA